MHLKHMQLSRSCCAAQDEPENDLDVETLRALENAVANFAGTALIISHDRWFLDRIATHILAFEDDGSQVCCTAPWSCTVSRHVAMHASQHLQGFWILCFGMLPRCGGRALPVDVSAACAGVLRRRLQRVRGRPEAAHRQRRPNPYQVQAYGAGLRRGGSYELIDYLLENERVD